MLVLRRFASAAAKAATTSGGSGHAEYALARTAKPQQIHKVPLVRGTPQSLEGFARVFPATKAAYDAETVDIEQWPRHANQRPLCPDSGRAGGIHEGLFTFKWVGDELTAINKAVGGNYITGKLHQEVSPKRRTGVLTREANYHPDGGQIVCPSHNEAFIALLAKPTDDIDPTKFVAFYCDGSFGIHINTNVWHQPVYPIADEATYYGKQGAVHACVVYDSVEEHGKWLYVPLTPTH